MQGQLAGIELRTPQHDTPDRVRRELWAGQSFLDQLAWIVAVGGKEQIERRTLLNLRIEAAGRAVDHFHRIQRMLLLVRRHQLIHANFKSAAAAITILSGACLSAACSGAITPSVNSHTTRTHQRLRIMPSPATMQPRRDHRRTRYRDPPFGT